MKNAIANITRPELKQDECEIPESQEITLNRVPGWEHQEESLGFSQLDDKIFEMVSTKPLQPGSVVPSIPPGKEAENLSAPNSPGFFVVAKFC